MTPLLQTVLAAAAPAGQQPPPGGLLGSMLLPMIIIFFIIWVLMIKPQRKKEQQRREMLDSIEKGDKVVTIGGVHGVLTSVREKEVVVRVDDDKGVKLKMNRSAVSRVVREGEEAAED